MCCGTTGNPVKRWLLFQKCGNLYPQKIHQVLWDLLINAAEAVQPHGRIRIAIETDDHVVTIEDSGPGINEGDLEKLFEPFFTTKDKGTGLGLANAYANIEAHGRHLYVEPGELGGARFIIDLSGSVISSGDLERF